MSRAEAERLLGVAEKLLQSRDLNGTKDFAVLAQETEPLLDGPEQILAVADVLLASDKRLPCASSSDGSALVPDWYSVLQLPRRSDDPDLARKQYRRLTLLLHPDKNKYPLSDQAFQLVTDAWAVLSDPIQKARYDADLGHFTKVDLPSSSSSKLPVRRSPRPARATAKAAARWTGNPDGRSSVSAAGNIRVNEVGSGPRVLSFWTVCPYCYMLFEYPRVYENCCLKCQGCEKAFHGAGITSMPPLVPGKEAYYCTWGFFPMGFMFKGAEGKSVEFPGWMPPVFANGMQQMIWPEVAPIPARVQPQPQPQPQPKPAVAAPAPASASAAVGHNRGGGGSGPEPGKKKRGRPRKNPVQT